MKPDDLNAAAGAKWDELVGRYDPSAADMLACYCRNFARYMECQKQMADSGLLYKNPSGLVTSSPMIAISAQMETQMKRQLEYLEKHRAVAPVVTDNDDLLSDFGG